MKLNKTSQHQAYGLLKKNLHIAGGTVVAMKRTRDRFIVVADSRSFDAQEREHWDEACKLNPLGSKAFFFVTGRAIMSDRLENILIDANKLPATVFQDFQTQPNTDGTLKKVAHYTALSLKATYQEIAAEHPVELSTYIYDGRLLMVVIGGTTEDSDFVALCVDIKMKTSEKTPYPLIESTVERLNDSIELAVFGSHEKDGVIEFLTNETERAKMANSNFQSELAKIVNPDREMLRLKAGVQAAIDWADNHRVGGPLDILELRKGGIINWIQRKPQCI